MSKRKRPDVAAAVDRLRSETVCSRCGGQPIEWHGEHHPVQPNRRISNMVGLGYKLADVLAEIAICEPLCRSCHMAGDGRATELAAHNDARLGVLKPPVPCTACGALARPTRKGLCMKCYDRSRVGRKRTRNRKPRGHWGPKGEPCSECRGEGTHA